jgi:hypothetical protein
MRVAVSVAFMLVSGAALPLEAGAQQGPVDRVKACAAVADDAARLKCYDAAVGGLQSDIQVPVYKLPELEATGRKTPPASTIVPKQTLDRISVGVSAIGIGADGKLRFTLSNGEDWRQTDSTSLKNLGKGPWEAELRKAAMGSYMLRIGNKAAVRVQQVK